MSRAASSLRCQCKINSKIVLDSHLGGNCLGGIGRGRASARHFCDAALDDLRAGKDAPDFRSEGARRPNWRAQENYQYAVRSSYEEAVRGFGNEGTLDDWFFAAMRAVFG